MGCDGPLAARAPVLSRITHEHALSGLPKMARATGSDNILRVVCATGLSVSCWEWASWAYMEMIRGCGHC